MTTKAKIKEHMAEVVAKNPGMSPDSLDAYERGLKSGIQMAKDAKKNDFAADDIPLPAFLSKEKWVDFCDHRRSVKTPMTRRAGELMINHLVRLARAGHDIDMCIDQSVKSGKWTDIYEVRGAPAVKTFTGRETAEQRTERMRNELRQRKGLGQ